MPDAPLQLDETDARAVVRLLADALAPDDGRAAKVNRLMDGLCAMVDAEGWIFFRSRMHPTGGPAANIDYLYGGGFDDRSLAAYADYSLEVHNEEGAEFPALKQLIAQGRHFTRTRPQLVGDDVWRCGRYDPHIRRIGFDAFMYSTIPLTERDGAPVCSTALLFRRPGRPDFDPRQTRLTHAIISECGHLHTDGLNLERADDVASLTPRLRAVLVMLIDGLSVKQVAHRLSLSEHTARTYIKQLYRQFNVQTRPQLLRRFMAADTQR